MDEKELKSKKSALSQLHHVAIVVSDIEKAIKYYSSIGLGPFESYPPITDYIKINVPDESAFYNLKIKVVQAGPVSIQLIQPGEGKTIYRDFLEKRGEGVFHLGFVVDDIEQEEAELQKLGLKVLSSGRRADGSGFTYFYTSEIGGVNVLIRQNPKEIKK